MVVENVKRGKNLIYCFTEIFCFLRKLNFFDNIINRIEKYVNFDEKDKKKPPRSILTIHDLLIKIGHVFDPFSINYVCIVKRVVFRNSITPLTQYHLPPLGFCSFIKKWWGVFPTKLVTMVIKIVF